MWYTVICTTSMYVFIFRYNVSVIISSKERVRKIKSRFQAYYVPTWHDQRLYSTVFHVFYLVSKQLRRKSHMTLLYTVFTKMLKSSYCKVHVYACCAFVMTTIIISSCFWFNRDQNFLLVKPWSSIVAIVIYLYVWNCLNLINEICGTESSPELGESGMEELL